MADAFIVNPGQAVGQGDWEALAAQHGGVKSTSPRAATEAEMKAAGLGGDDDPAFQQRPIYRYYFNDGTFVEARTAANGADYQVVDYKPSQKFTQAQAQQTRAESPATPAAQRTAREEAEIAANAALPPDQDPRPETNAQRAERAARTIKEQGEAAAADERRKDTTVESVVYEGKGKERKKVTTYQSGRKLVEDAATNASPVAVTYDADGTKVTKYDDGTETREQLSPAQRRAEQQATQVDEIRKPVAGKDGKQYTEVTKKDPNTGRTETWYEDDQGRRTALPGSAMAGLKDVPPFTPDLMQPGGGIIARAKQLDELLAAGKITWEQRQAILASDAETTKAVAGEFNTATTLLREKYQADLQQRGQDMTQANTRANLANQHHQNAIGLIEKFAPFLGATAGDAGKLFVGMMASQLATATMYGGMRESPRVEMDPRLRQFADRKLDAALGTATPPGPGQLPAATPPNAIGAGAVPVAVTPIGAPPSLAAEMQATPAVDPAQVRAEHAASGQPLPAPLLAPAPMVPAPPTPAVTQTDPLAMAPTGDPTAMEAMYGKVLPEAKSWREEAEERLFALRMPQVPGVSLPGIGVSLPGIGASLPEQYAPAVPSMDYSLPLPTADPYGFGGDIDAEARRQLLADGIMV